MATMMGVWCISLSVNFIGYNCCAPVVGGVGLHIVELFAPMPFVLRPLEAFSFICISRTGWGAVPWQPLKQVAQVARDVQHQGCSSRVRLRKGDAHAESLNADAARYRKSGDEAARIGAHIGACLVVVAYA